MNDYDRIAKVIRFVGEHENRQFDPASLAAVVDLSPHHFHRLFARWAGITPKDFLHRLTVEHARGLLREGRCMQGSGIESGLSASGYSHNLCVCLEAGSSGGIECGGSGWSIAAGFSESPFGLCLIAECPRGICHLSFIEEGDEVGAWGNLETLWPNAVVLRDDRRTGMLCDQIFKVGSLGGRSPGPSFLQPLKLFVKGTDFQVKVWEALLRIPEGALVSYGRLAEQVGIPRASRAVGAAVGGNPIGYLIPCHRVIRNTGVIGGYRWGDVRKKAILARETLATGG